MNKIFCMSGYCVALKKNSQLITLHFTLHTSSNEIWTKHQFAVRFCAIFSAYYAAQTIAFAEQTDLTIVWPAFLSIKILNKWGKFQNEKWTKRELIQIKRVSCSLYFLCFFLIILFLFPCLFSSLSLYEFYPVWIQYIH